jgi:uncharacterized cupin superfamily protein
MNIQVRKLTDDERKKRLIPPKPAEVNGWSIWECNPSKFNWHYESEESAFLYEGWVKVKTNTETVEFRKGDFVVFPTGLSCQWEVLEKVVKVYRFK